MTQVEAMQNLTAIHWRRASPDHIESTDGKWQVWKLRDGSAYTLWLKAGDKFVHQSTHASAEEAKSAVPA